MNYSTKDIRKICGVSDSAIRNWAEEFSTYLTQFEDGAKRIYTENDVRVFTLISDMKNAGKQYKDIHASLASGERGWIPSSIEFDDEPDQVQVLQRRLDIATATIRDLQIKIAELETELRVIKEKAAEEVKRAEDQGRVQGELDALRRQLEQQLKEK